MKPFSLIHAFFACAAAAADLLAAAARWPSALSVMPVGMGAGSASSCAASSP